MSDLKGLPSALATYDWSEGADLDVHAGDLWLLSWDVTYLGLVCVAAVKRGYILGWPVTPPDEPAFAPALIVPQSALDGPVHLWPTRETGLGMHLLHKPLGRLIDPKSIQPVAWAMEDGENPGFAFAQGSASDPANAPMDEAMVEHWTALCFHTWPDVASSPLLSETRIKRAGGTSGRAAKLLALTPASLRPLWTGVQPATEEQVNTLAADLGVEPSEILADDPLSDAVDRLAVPLFKEPLLGLASRAGITEGAARSRAREQYSLAARDDSLSVSDARLLDAIERA